MKAIQPVLTIWMICLCLVDCAHPGTRTKLQDLSIVDGNTSVVTFQVEVAKKNSSRKKGLMYRKVLPANQGMLLDYRYPAKMGIWMKNTYIPLDLLFIDAYGIIIKIHEGAEPLSTKTIESGAEVRAVLEINAGQVREFGLEVGYRVRHASFISR